MPQTDEFGNVFYDEGDVEITDPHGNVLFTNDPGGAINGAFGYAVADFILYGVVNGAFSQGPPLGVGTSIGSNNPMPYWTGPWMVSGNSLDATWVADAASSSGYNLRFTMAAGAAGDEAFFEQIVPIGGSRSRWYSVWPRLSVYRVTATGGTPRAFHTLTHLTADGSVTGPSTTATADLTADATLYQTWSTGASFSPPADAYFLRIRIGVRRNTMAASDTALVDMTDIRADRGGAQTLLGEVTQPATYAPGVILQQAGSIYIKPVSSTTTYAQIDNVTGNFNIYAVNDVYFASADVLVKEVTAPGTPASGWYAIYAKTDGMLYGKNDGGTEYRMGYYTGTGSPEGVVTAPVGSLFLRTDGGVGTTLYVKQSGSGNTGWGAK